MIINIYQFVIKQLKGSMYKFYVGKNAASQWYIKLIAGNGEIIIWSEGYTSKQNALNAISLVKNYAPSASVYEA